MCFGHIIELDKIDSRLTRVNFDGIKSPTFNRETLNLQDNISVKVYSKH